MRLLHRLLENGAYRFSFFLDFEATRTTTRYAQTTLDLQTVSQFENALKLREADLEEIENRVDGSNTMERELAVYDILTGLLFV
jgi:hypothetical protein